MDVLHANSFEIGFPAGWEDRSQVTLVGPPQIGFTPNVQINQEPVPEGVDVFQYFDEQKRELATLPEFEQVETGDRMLGGVSADFHGWRWTVPQGYRIRQLQYVFVRGATVFTVTCSALDDQWDQQSAMFDMMLAQFRFRELWGWVVF